jgi:4'-phosphopantetheinyl transferase
MAMIHVYWNLVQGLPRREVDFLSQVEKKRLSQMRFARRRQSFQLGRWAIKQLLRMHPTCADRPSASITIANHSAGGPFVQIGDRDLDGCISISHRENEAVSAMVIDPGVAVGIDLELVEERGRSFVEDFFTSKESNQIDLLPEEEKSVAVTRTWSAKEAVLKALKVGLHVDSRAVSINQSQRASRKDGWRMLDASGPALENCACRVWWRSSGQYVLTLAITAKKDFPNEFEPLLLEHVPQFENELLN